MKDKAISTPNKPNSLSPKFSQSFCEAPSWSLPTLTIQYTKLWFNKRTWTIPRISIRTWLTPNSLALEIELIFRRQLVTWRGSRPETCQNMSKRQGFLYGQKQHSLQEEVHLLVKAHSSTSRWKRYSLGLVCKQMPFSQNPPMKTITILRIPV